MCVIEVRVVEVCVIQVSTTALSSSRFPNTSRAATNTWRYAFKTRAARLCRALQHTPQHDALKHTLQHDATYTATRCNTHCNTLQHDAAQWHKLHGEGGEKLQCTLRQAAAQRHKIYDQGSETFGWYTNKGSETFEWYTNKGSKTFGWYTRDLWVVHKWGQGECTSQKSLDLFLRWTRRIRRRGRPQGNVPPRWQPHTRQGRRDTAKHYKIHCNALQRTATHCNTMQHALHDTLQDTLQHNDTNHANGQGRRDTAMHCNTMQQNDTNYTIRVATHCNTHCNTQCNTLQHNDTNYTTRATNLSAKETSWKQDFDPLHPLLIDLYHYGVATICKPLKIIGLFCKRAL